MKETPDVWSLFYEQTPRVLQFVLGVLSLGVFTIFGVLWKWQRNDVARVEKQVHDRIDSLEQRLQTRMDETNRLLMQIATNTQRSQRDER